MQYTRHYDRSWGDQRLTEKHTVPLYHKPNNDSNTSLGKSYDEVLMFP